MEESFKIVQQLVFDFKANEKAYLAPSYSESQVRQDFIDKFFTALGWDVTHSVQKNPYEQEVKIENKVTMAGSQRRADYAFSVAPNFDQVKFFVEAKKPSRSLANADDYFQTIRYAWNTRIPIAVLTDFEEFHILDCRYKPNIKTALDRKIGEYRYTNYTNEEIFAKIFHLFGREAVAAGSLQKYAEELPKKGIKQAAGMQLVDDAFLEELDGYREILAKAFKKTNESLQGDELTESVQRTIDRLVFIRFLEDKGIEDRQIISITDPKSAWKSFVTLCKRFEPKYNGLVFKPHRILDSADFQSPDGYIFAGICQKLSDPSSPYDFNQIPISILGSIYERFLGKVVHATDKRVKVEEKPEVRKAGGVYYTPEYIVRYIVEETVGKLIEGKTPQQITAMSFVDIACGSGSFLIEVYGQILDHHLKYYLVHPESVEKDILYERDGKKYLTLKKKKEILTNNVYGVDIDFQATEVTQLSLYLKMLENATMNDAHQFGLFKETILPDLRQNIICGNSLIERDIIDGQLFSTIDEHKIKPMNYEDAFSKIIKRGGFDAVVGNPPYVRQELFTDLKPYLESKYKVFHGTADLYTYFIERGILLLRRNGLFSIIVANKWIRANYGEPLRDWLKDQGLFRIIDFGDLPVFQGVTTYPCIIIVHKGLLTENISVAKIESLDNINLSSAVDSLGFQIQRSQLSNNAWTLTDEKSSLLLNKLRSVGVPFDEYIKGKIYRGVLTGFNQAFVIDEITKKRLLSEDPKCSELIKPFLVGKDIKRYETLSAEQYLIFTRRGTDLKYYPSIEKYLSHYKEYLTPKPKTFKGSNWEGRKPGNYKWFEIQDSVDYFKAFEKPKIIFPNICKKPQFTFDDKTLYTNQKCFIIESDDLYLLGLLNSSVTYYLFKKLLPKLRGDYYEPSYIYFKDFPIRAINNDLNSDKANRDKIIDWVGQILESKRKLSQTKTDSETNRLDLLCSSLERKIDETVYELYGLTGDEIKILEESL